MAWNTRKIKVYARLAMVCLLVLVVLAFVLSNSRPVSIRFLWWQTPELPLYWLLLFTAGGGIVFYLVSRRIAGVIRDVRKLRREEQEQKRVVTEIKNELEKKQENSIM